MKEREQGKKTGKFETGGIWEEKKQGTMGERKLGE